MEKAEKIILFQGDSITDGGRLKGRQNEWDLNHQMGHGYAFLINAAMGCRYPEKNLCFFNRGVSGNRIADLYGRWTEDTLCLKPDILSVLVGINDCGSTLHDGAGSPPARFEKIFQLMLDEVREANPAVKIVLCEPFALPVGPLQDDFDAWRELLEPLQEKVRCVAEKNRAVFVPLQERFQELLSVREAKYWVWDGVHPTVCGHQVIAQQWMDCTGCSAGAFL
ncbi:MAG: SGNH/GDSL hydrolase family protein [Lachnospiraceae bacterium]|nr:SGNH/GDSL hydrolase family protein [Lachnospiraceae bacterium]